ncbi:MAG: hypothetical protein HY706_11400 [Candidatus Hydrogenedentes bacterium]|nr:hypothetical protein [Candidatus Hydrogenedentota bacterium]
MQRILFVLAALPVMAVLSGCDGKGLGIGPIKVDADERPTDQTGDTGTGGTGGGGGTTPSENRFAGTWVASYGDDRVTDLAPLGRNQYAVRILLSQDGTTLSGSGTMFRMFEEGATAQDEVALRVSGTTSGDDATLAFRPSATGQFTNDHTWFVRLGSNRLTGMYTENDINNVLIRSGHAAWFRVAAADIDDAWVTRLSDAFAATGLTADDRTAALTLALSSEGALSGAGTFVVQVADNVASELNYNVTGGGLSSSRLTYTFGELDLISNEMDWFGFFNGNLLVVAYGQFNAADELIRLGHATWYRSPAAGPSAVTNTWVTSFSDTAVLPDTARTDHVATV